MTVHNVTATKTTIALVADTTFPSGIDLDDLAGDTNPFAVAAQQIADTQMGANGDLVTWAVYTPTEVTVAVIPGSTTDQNLMILAQANTVSPSSSLSEDTITVTSIYPDDVQDVFSDGVIISAPLGRTWNSNGSFATNSYVFRFGSVSRS